MVDWEYEFPPRMLIQSCNRLKRSLHPSRITFSTRTESMVMISTTKLGQCQQGQWKEERRGSRQDLPTTARQASEGCGFCTGERSFHLAYRSIPRRAWLHTTQVCFHDALALWYGSRLPSKCECANNFNVDHALSCAKGSFPSLIQNEIWDITTSLLTEVCSEVCVEPDLQPVTTDQLNGASANSQDGARLDVSANGVWGGRFQKTYFDVRIFNPLTPSNRNQAPVAVYRKRKLEKRWLISSGYKRWNTPPLPPLSFQPQEVYMGNEATTFYKHLALLLAQK